MVMCSYYDIDNVMRRVVPIYCIYTCDICKCMAFFMTGGQIKDVTDQGFTGSDVKGGSFFCFQRLEKVLKATFANPQTYHSKL